MIISATILEVAKMIAGAVIESLVDRGMVADWELIATFLHGLRDPNTFVPTACGIALARLTKRFPQVKAQIEQQLAVAIGDPQFEKRDDISNRTGQDYAHEALWQVVSERITDPRIIL